MCIATVLCIPTLRRAFWSIRPLLSLSMSASVKGTLWGLPDWTISKCSCLTQWSVHRRGTFNGWCIGKEGTERQLFVFETRYVWWVPSNRPLRHTQGQRPRPPHPFACGWWWSFLGLLAHFPLTGMKERLLITLKGECGRKWAGVGWSWAGTQGVVLSSRVGPNPCGGHTIHSLPPG